MDGGLRAAVRVSPPLYLKTDDFLSNRWGPPQSALSATAEVADVGSAWFQVFGLDMLIGHPTTTIKPGRQRQEFESIEARANRVSDAKLFQISRDGRRSTRLRHFRAEGVDAAALGVGIAPM
jgi:hypothetical protein